MKNIGSIHVISSRLILSLMLILITGVMITAEASERIGRSRLFVVENELVSATLDSVSLKTILDNIGIISGVTYKADENILNERITVTFSNLSIEEVLKRVLQRFNHVMMFNSDRAPVSVHVLGEKGNKTGNVVIAGSTSSPQRRENPIQQRETRKVSTIEQKSPRQIVTSTSAPNIKREIVKISEPGKTSGQAGDRNLPGSPR